MPELSPVDGDPFAPKKPKGPQLVPYQGDPFAKTPAAKAAVPQQATPTAGASTTRSPDNTPTTPTGNNKLVPVQHDPFAGVDPSQPTITQRDRATAQAGTGAQAFDPLANPASAHDRESRRLVDLWQNAASKAKAPANEGWGPYGVKMAREAALGLPFADRAIAGTQHLLGRGSYEDILQGVRAQSEQHHKDYPKASFAANMGGAMALPGGSIGALGRAGRLGSAAEGAALGAGWGGLYGLSNAPDWTKGTDTLNSALKGGVLGGVMGSALGGAFPKEPRTVVPQALPARQAAADVAQAKWGNETAQAVKGVFQDTFGYGTETAKAAQAEARSFLGENARNVAIRERATDEFQKAWNALPPTETLHPGVAQRMTTTLAGNAEAAKAVQPSQLAFMEYMQKRTSGLPWPFKDQTLKPLADELRSQNQEAYARIAALPDKWRFAAREDYLKGMYETPKTGQAAGPRGISGGFTKAKEYPSYVEAIENGLIPKTSDPIALVAHSAANSDQWAARHEWFEKAKAGGQIRYARPNKIPDGMTKLEGFDWLANSGRFVPVASSDWAQVFNTTYGAGFNGPLMDTVRSLGNAAKQADLGFSGYHAFTMMNEYNASRLGQMWNEALNMRPGMAARSGVEAFVGPFREATPFSKGKELIDEYTRPGTTRDPTMKLTAELATSANFHLKPTRMDILRSEVGGPSGVTAWKMWERGTLGKEFKAGARSIVTSWKDRPARMAIQTAIGAAVGGFGAQQTGVDPREGALAGAIAGAGGLRPLQKVTEAVMSPLFQTYIPRMKAAAFYSKMNSFLQLNPSASRADLEGAARKIADSMDNRLGEMNRDNLFWSAKAHDIAQMTMLSPTWNVGTFREIAGAYPDLVARMGAGAKLLESGERAHGLETKLEYIAGFLTSTYVMGSAYEYFMTEGGKQPQGAANPPRDALAQMHPRTGGVIPRPPGAAGKYQPKPLPEEAQLPGYQKDVLSAKNSIERALQGDFAPMQQEVAAKGSPLVHALDRMLTGEDWKGTPLADPHEGLSGAIKGALGGFGQAFVPISAQQLAQSAKPGTAIPWWQTLMGIRRAGKQYYDPEGYAGIRDYQRLKAAGLDAQGTKKALKKAQASKDPEQIRKARDNLVRARQDEARSKRRQPTYGGNP